MLDYLNYFRIFYIFWGLMDLQIDVRAGQTWTYDSGEGVKAWNQQFIDFDQNFIRNRTTFEQFQKAIEFAVSQKSPTQIAPGKTHVWGKMGGWRERMRVELGNWQILGIIFLRQLSLSFSLILPIHIYINSIQNNKNRIEIGMEIFRFFLPITTIMGYVLLGLPTVAANLICDGDFQHYGIQHVDNDYLFLQSNYSCWYNQIGGIMEVKYKSTPIHTCYCELVHTTKYVLCQNLSLSASKTYQLNFTIFNGDLITFSTVYVYVNREQVLDFTTLNADNISHVTFYFQATLQSTQICFDSITNSGVGDNGAGVDNVTLLDVTPGAGFQVECTTALDQIWEQARITCQFSPEASAYLPKIRELVSVSCPQSNQQIPVQITLNETSLAVNINLDNNLRLDCLAIEVSEGTGNVAPLPEFQFQVYGLPVTAVKRKESQKLLIQEMYKISVFVVGGIDKMYLIMKTCIASYFLINIISFWNLSLMYNVLNISTIPAFSKSFLQKLTFQFFNLNSLTEWAQERIPSLRGNLNFDQLQGREFIDMTKNTYAWFGSYGISSNFLHNNFQTFFLIFLMVAKILIILLLRRRPALAKLLPQKAKLIKLFLMEIITLQTFMIMSSAATLLNLNATGQKQKLNNILQIISLWISLMVISLYFIKCKKCKLVKLKQIKINITANKSTKNQRVSIGYKKADKITEAEYFTILKKFMKYRVRAIEAAELYNIFQFAGIVTIPTLILLNHPSAFLGATTLLLLYRLHWFCKNVGRFNVKLDDKIFIGLNILFWVALQGSFITLWILEQIVNSNSSQGESTPKNIYTCIKFIGFIIVFTVLLGGMFEILRFAIQVLKILFKFLKILLKILLKKCKKQTNSPQQNKPTKSAKIRLVRIGVLKNNDKLTPSKSCKQKAKRDNKFTQSILKTKKNIISFKSTRKQIP